MGNGTARKKTPAGMVVLQGVLVSLAIYLLAAVVLALLAVKGVMPEERPGRGDDLRPAGTLGGAARRDGGCCWIRSSAGGSGVALLD